MFRSLKTKIQVCNLPCDRAGPGYHSLDRDRDGYGGGGERDFMPIDRPRERSLDRGMEYGQQPPGYGGGGGVGKKNFFTGLIQCTLNMYFSYRCLLIIHSQTISDQLKAVKDFYNFK